MTEKCLKVSGLFDALINEENKLVVLEDRNETYIVVDDGDK